MASHLNGQLAHDREVELMGEMEAAMGVGQHEHGHPSHEFGHANHEFGHASHEFEDELATVLHEDEFETSVPGHHEYETATSHEFGAHPFNEFETPVPGHHEYETGTAHPFNEFGVPGAHHYNEYETPGGALHEGEQFFGKLRKLARGVGRFVSKAAPILKSVARIALPMVASVVGGPVGMIAGKIASQALGEDEFEDELGGILHEDEHAGSQHEGEAGHVSHETHPLHQAMPELSGIGGHHESHGSMHEVPQGQHEVVADMLAESAAIAHHEAEAEAMVGAAVVATLSASDRAVLRALLPHLVRGVAVLTQILRRRRITRPVVRTVPTIFRQTVQTLRRRLVAGQPVNRRVAGQLLATATQRMLTSPRLCGATIVRNLRSNLQTRRVNG